MSSKTKTTSTKEEAKPALVPKLRFPEFRNAEVWDEKAFGELLDDIIDFRGRTPIKLGMNWGNGNITSLSANNVKNGFIDYKAECNLGSEELYQRWMGDVNLEKDDIVFTMEAPLGNALLLPDSRKYILSQRVVAFKTNSEVRNPFLVQLIWSEGFQDAINELATGSTAKGINQKALKTILVAVPRPLEQQKIAECLSSVDELIAAQARKLDALKTHKKGLMQQLFPGEGETQPRLRFPEFRDAGEWEDTTLGQLAKLVRGPFGGSLKKEIFVASGFAVYEQQHAIYSDFNSFRYHITAEKFHELRRFAVCANDIIMSCSGTMGRFAIIPDGAAPGVINQALLKLTPNGRCDTKFLKEVLELPSVQEKLLSQSAGGAIQNVVSVDQIKALPMRLPSAEEQRAVVGCLTSLDDLIAAQTQKHEALKTHKKGLMQQLFPSPEEPTNL
jgi:type I restriction enzyme S subunit